MNEDSILKLITPKLKDAVSFCNSNIAAKQEKSLGYYKRDYLPGDDKIRGKSKFVSPVIQQHTDWLTANLVRILTAPEKVVEFLPNGAEDDAIAKQQTDVCNFILTQKNRHLGFLHPWIQTGLLNGVSIITAEFETVVEESLPRLIKGVVPEQLVMFDQQEEQGAIIIEEASKPYFGQLPGVELRDLKIRTVNKTPALTILPIAPEDVVLSKDARIDSVTGGIAARLQGSRKYVSRQDLIDLGFDADKVQRIPNAHDKKDGVALVRSRDLDSEQGIAPDDVEVYTIYTKLKLDKKSRHYRLTLAGDLNSAVLLDYDEVSKTYPLAAFVPFPVAGILWGLGIPDRIGDDHVLISKMQRAVIDSLHNHVNPTVIANTETTNLDDLLNMHPGSVVRSMDPTGGISYNVPPFAGADAIPVIQNHNQSLDLSTGVGSQMISLNASDLQNVTATSANQRSNSSQLLLEAISRYFAETGYAYLCRMVINLLVEKPEEAQALISRLTNNYIPIDQFNADYDTSISVSFGIMSRDQSTATLTNLLGQQMAAMQAGLPVVQPQHIYNTLSKLTETAGFKASTQFFQNPADLPPAPPPSPPPPSEAQIMADAERLKAELKFQADEADRQFQMAKISAELDLKRAQMQIDAELKAKELELKYAKPVEEDTITIVEQVPSYPEAYIG